MDTYCGWMTDRAIGVYGFHMASTTEALPRLRWRCAQKVRRDGDELVWDVEATRRKGGECVGGETFLEGFLALAEATDEAVVDYAERWGGVLAFCRHGLPGASPRHLEDPDRPGASWCEPTVREPLDEWRRWSRLAGVVLKVSGAVAAGKSVPSSLWPELLPFAYGGVKVFAGVEPGFENLTTPRGIGARRALVAQAVSYWLEAGGARVGMEWSTGARPRLVIGSGGLPDAGIFGALGVELAGRCAKAERLDVCDGCGRPFLMNPKQRARLEQTPGTRTFCPDCREAGVPARMADQDRRARQRAARGK